MSGPWIISIFSIGNICGCFLGGFLNQKIGTRKCYILIVAPIAALSWVMIAVATHLWMILLARVLAGIMYGIVQANGKGLERRSWCYSRLHVFSWQYLHLHYGLLHVLAHCCLASADPCLSSLDIHVYCHRVSLLAGEEG